MKYANECKHNNGVFFMYSEGNLHVGERCSECKYLLRWIKKEEISTILEYTTILPYHILIKGELVIPSTH